MTASLSSKKSTNVRSVPMALRALRAGLWLASRTAPPVATRMALELFLRPRRYKRPSWERGLLFHANASSVPWHGRSLPMWTWGEGPRVLLMHGWEGRGTQLGAFVDPLVRAGFQVIAFDAPGHGDGPGNHASIPEFADAIAAVRAHVGPLHAVVAHSMGAVSTLLASARRPLAERIVSVASPSQISSAFRSFGDALDLDEGVLAALPHAVEDRFALRLEELELSALAERVTVPTLVVHDLDDKDVEYASGERIAKALPNAKLVTTRGLGHRKILRDPQVVAHVVAFVEQGAPERSSGYSITDALVRDLYQREDRTLPT